MRKPLILSLLLALLLSLGGCGMGGSIYANSRSVENLQIVNALGIDREEGGDVRLSSCSSLGGDADKPLLLSAAAPTLTRAMELCQDYSPKLELFYAHTGATVFGEEALRQGIGEYLDFAERETRFRPGAHLFVLRGGTAAELFEGRAGSDSGVGDMLASLEQGVRKGGRGLVTTFVDVAKSLEETDAALLCAIALRAPEDVVASEEGAETLAVPAGLAVLKEGKLLDFLPEDAARGVCFLLGKTSGSTLELEDGGAVVEITGSRVSYRPVWSGEKLERLEIAVKAGGAVVERRASSGAEGSRAPDELEDALRRKILDCVSRAVDASQNLGADFLGVAGRIDLASPERFAALRESWTALWPGLTVALSVDACLDHGYNLTDSKQLTDSDQSLGG